MSIRDNTVKGIAWNSIGTIGAGIINLMITMILARMISPAEFGLLELLAIFVTISDTVVDSGFSQALIRDNDANDVDKSSVFYVNLFISIAIYAILFFCAPIIANFYDEDALIPLSRFVFLVVIFHSLAIVQNAIFNKNLDFRRPAFSALMAMFIAGVIAILMAFNDYGVWALAVNMVLFAFLKMLFLWIQSKWKPQLVISIISIKKYIKFGGYLLLQGLFDKVVTNLESLLIGKYYTKADLGYFSQARKFDSYITQTSTGVIQRVTYPALSKIRSNPNNLKEGYRRVLCMTMFGMLPILAFVYVTAPNLLLILYGKQWIGSAPYLRLWVIAGLLVSIYSIFINIFLVKGKSKLLLIISFFRQVLRIFTILLLIHIGVLALLQGIIIVTLISAIVYMYYGGKLINYTLADIIKDVWQLMVATLLSIVAIYITGFILISLPFYVVFILQMIIMIVMYLCTLAVLKNKQLMEITDIVKSLLVKKH